MPAPAQIDPNKLRQLALTLFQGSSFVAPAAPPEDPSAPPTGRFAGGSPPALDAPATAMPSLAMPKAPSPIDVPNYGAWKTANPQPIPARPVGDFDTGAHPKLRSALQAMFAGLATLGSSLRGAPDAGEPIVSRRFAQMDAQREYDRTAPVLQEQANQAGYGRFLQQSKEGQEVGLQNFGAQTQAYQLNRENQARVGNFVQGAMQDKQAGALDDNTIIQKWMTEASSAGVPLSEGYLRSIIQRTPSAPPQFKLGPSGIAEPITYKGIQYDPIRESQGEPPEVSEARRHYGAVNKQYVQEQKDRANEAARIQGEAQGRGFENAANQQKRTQDFETLQKGREGAGKALAEIRDATNQQQMIQDLLNGKFNPASQTAAMFKLIGMEQPVGSHRIMPAEVEGVEKLGGLSERLKQKLLSWKEGDRFDPDLIPDVIETAKILNQNKIKTANDTLEDNFNTYGYKHPGTGPRGRLDEVPETAAATGPRFTGPKTQSDAQPKTISLDAIKRAAADNKVSVEEARRQAEAQGYTVK